MRQLTRFILAALILLGGISVFGCNQTQPAAPPSPAPSPKAASPSAAPASPAAASPSAAPATSSPSARASGTSASPAAGKGGEVATDAGGWTRKEYPAAGVEFDVPGNFGNFNPETDDMAGWLSSISANKKMVVLVSANEWKEWDDIMKFCDKILNDWKASEDKPVKDKTKDGIPVYYDYGTATMKDYGTGTKKTYVVLVAGYELSHHDFIMIVAGDPQDKSFKDTAIHIFNSVTREAKAQKAEDEKNEDDK